MTKVKICGIKTPDAMEAAIYGGSDFVGLVFCPQSPRHIDIEVATYLSHYVPATTSIVGLFVNPSDETFKQTLTNVRLDMIQLHGDEDVHRVQEIANLTKRPIIKSFSVQSKDTLQAIAAFEPYIDWILLDSSAGGSGETFNWTLLNGFKPTKPWMLAGGLNAQNVEDAIQRLNPQAVDVSSGVEITRGVKSPDKIKEFIHAVKKT